MNLAKHLTHPIFQTISQIADETGMETYVVGGYVRDILLNRPSVDIDFVTVGSGIEFAKALSAKLGRKTPLTVYANYGTAQIKHHGLELEFVGARKESYHRESRNPIVEDGTLEDDQLRRDFTVNAMAISLNSNTFGELVDPFDGIADLKAKVLRTPCDPDITFSDDPLRMMRAIRFACQLGFQINPLTFKAIKDNADRISIITKERINDELGKIMRSAKPSIGLRLLDMAGLLPKILPWIHELKGVESKEGKGHKDNFLHTVQVVDNIAAVSDNEWLRWAALFHDVGKPASKRFVPGTGWTFKNHNFIGEKMIPRIFREMKMPQNEKMKYVAKLVGMHMRPQSVAEEGVTDSGIRRMITDAGNDIEDLMLLAEADITSKNPEKVRKILTNFSLLRDRIDDVIRKDDYRNWKNPVSGNEIMEIFGIGPSKPVGEILQAVKDAIMDCSIENEHDAALDFAISKGKSWGLNTKL